MPYLTTIASECAVDVLTWGVCVYNLGSRIGCLEITCGWSVLSQFTGRIKGCIAYSSTRKHTHTHAQQTSRFLCGWTRYLMCSFFAKSTATPAADLRKSWPTYHPRTDGYALLSQFRLATSRGRQAGFPHASMCDEYLEATGSSNLQKQCCWRANIINAKPWTLNPNPTITLNP